jgi:hypothetical protein
MNVRQPFQALPFLVCGLYGEVKEFPFGRSGEEFAGIDLLVRGKLPAGEQEVELVFLGQSAG